MMETTERPWRQIMEAALMQHPQAVVQNTIRLWKQLAPELISIIGEDSFNPLYAKSVRLACMQHSWLAQEATTFAGSNERFAALEERLQAQNIMRAGLASMALFNIFLNELASLIGEGLTTHLLRLTSSQQTSAILPEHKTAKAVQRVVLFCKATDGHWPK